MAKNIIVCCDGTGNEFGKKEENTNVIKLSQLVVKDNPTAQMCFYDPGVGTFSSYAALTWVGKKITKFFGLLFAYGITQNIEDAYTFLMDTYEDGDRVYIFGFSRGAFTARALAGMLHKCGLLKKNNKNLLRYATRMYRFEKDEETYKSFKETFCRECKPHFIGVWDTVKSVGVLAPKKWSKFPNSKLNPDVKFGRHAISIDEKRSMFRPNLWGTPSSLDQSIEQVWFAGVHSDVGGSYAQAGLANIALWWIVEEAEEQGLILQGGAKSMCRPNPTGKMHNSLLPIWWVLAGWTRTISNSDGIHQSVFERMGLGQNYVPKNIPKIYKFIPANQTYSVQTKHLDELQVKDRREFCVKASEHYSWTGVKLVQGGHYLFTIPQGQYWWDSGIKCGPDGWEPETQKLNFIQKIILRKMKKYRRVAKAPFFELIGAVGRSDENLFRINQHKTDPQSPPFICPANEILYVFANDLKRMYFNNKGEMKVIIERIK